MTLNAQCSKLSTTLTFFNNKLDQSNKLDDRALQTIQNYLNDPQVTTLEGQDEEKIQHSLSKLEKLREEATLDRVSSTVIKKINRHLKNLERFIVENFEKIKEDAYFIVVKLEVCFREVLTENAESSSQHWRKIYEKMTSSAVSETPRETTHVHALYPDKQQRLISELMNAALFNVIEYFQNKKERFSEHFEEKLLDLLNEKAKNLDLPLDNQINNDIFEILSKTAKDCNLAMTDLIHHLKYAMIGFGERMNEFAVPLQEYIRSTQSPTLAGFNKTIDSCSRLSPIEVDQFNGLFDLYCKLVLSAPRKMAQSQV